MQDIRLLVIAGSARNGSLSLRLANAARAMALAGALHPARQARLP